MAIALNGSAVAQDAARPTSLFQFNQTTGYDPGAGVITDKHGAIYGTTDGGGTGPCSAGAGCGTVYALSPPAPGGSGWTFSKLYDFQGGRDGSFPSAPLALAPNGSLYGYTTGGNYGTVWELQRPTKLGDSWKFQILYTFTGKADGNLLSVYPALVYRDGALYGVASGGSLVCGQFGCGSVFRLTPNPRGGEWLEKTLYEFTGAGPDGQPDAIVGFAENGPLYVSTTLGNGEVAQFSPPASTGPWTERVLTQFAGGADGKSPSNLVLAPDGTLYGLANGASTGGLTFQLTPPVTAAGTWTRTKIAAISYHRYGPSSLARGANGSLIGVIEGDFDFFAGSAFQLTPPVSGASWTYRELWNFNNGPDRNPLGVVTGRGGNLFGVLYGGGYSGGLVFELRKP